MIILVWRPRSRPNARGGAISCYGWYPRTALPDWGHDPIFRRQSRWVGDTGRGARIFRGRMSAHTTLSHVYPHGTRVNARGNLELGGCDALELAARFGTPVYVVVEDDLRVRARAVGDAGAAPP